MNTQHINSAILFVLFFFTCNPMQIPAGIMPYTYYKGKSHVLFVQESTAVKGRQLLWNSCGGKAEPNETPVQTACRECSEETKYLWGNILAKYQENSVSPEMLNFLLARSNKENVLALTLMPKTYSKVEKIINESHQESYNYFLKRIKEKLSLRCPNSGYKLYFAEVDYIEAATLRYAPATPECFKENYAWVPVEELCKAITTAEQNQGRQAIYSLTIPKKSLETDYKSTKIYTGTARLLMSTEGKKILNFILLRQKTTGFSPVDEWQVEPFVALA